jgi:hypothetical protein
MEAAFHFVSPATDTFNFAMTDVNAHFYPLTDAAKVCVREVVAPAVGEGSAQPCSGPCIASGTVDQMYSGPHDGRWQRALSAVPLVFNRSYEFAVTWDAMRGGVRELLNFLVFCGWVLILSYYYHIIVLTWIIVHGVRT